MIRMPLYFCFLLTEVSKSEKPTHENSGLAIKARLANRKFVIQTGDRDVNRKNVKHTGEKKKINNPHKKY